jgi:hypothetical protein
MASFDISDPPQNLTMNDFRAISDDYGGLVKTCRFAVRLLPTGSLLQGYSSFCRDFTYLCEIAEMPGRGFMNLDIRYYGPSHKLPFQTTYEDMNLTFLCRSDSIERQFFDDWMYHVNPTNTFDFNYRDEYRAQIEIYQFADYSEDEYDSAPEATYCITVHNAYPILINPQPMTWGDAQFQRVVVSFTYTHWSRKNRDPEPASFELIEARPGSPGGLPNRSR